MTQTLSPNDRVAALQVFARSLQDRPLDPAIADDEHLYVKALHVQEHDGLTIDPVGRLAAQIDRAEGSRVWLFTGNIGSGKSTELRRLRQELKARGCIVFLADAADYINLNQKIEISDFLISITAAIAEQAGDYLGQDQIRRGYWERIGNFLTRTNVEVSETGLPEIDGIPLIGDLKAALRQDPTVKQVLQKHLRGHLSSLRDDLEAYRNDILEQIRTRPGNDDVKIVFLLDSLERLRGKGDADDDVFSSVKDMFAQYHDMLRLADIQTVYSVAPYLIKLAPQLNGVFGAGAMCHLTTAHVFQRHSHELDLQCGVPVMRQIVDARYPAWRALIAEATLDRIVEFSGGDLRDFFRLLSIVLLELEYSNDEAAVLRFALEQLRRDMTWISKSQLERLRQIARTKSPSLESEADRDALIHDLETKRVLMYRNGDDWYDVHPLLRELIKPLPAGTLGDEG